MLHKQYIGYLPLIQVRYRNNDLYNDLMSKVKTKSYKTLSLRHETPFKLRRKSVLFYNMKYQKKF